MAKFLLAGISLFIFSACSQESQPYEDINSTLSSQKTGHIQTH